MRAYTKMMLASHGMGQEQRREPQQGHEAMLSRPEYTGYENRYFGAEPPESRRRRYKNGRFAPSGAMDMGMDDTYNGLENAYRMDDDGDRMIGFSAHYGGGRRESTMERGKTLRGHMDRKRMDRKTAQEWVRSMEHADGSHGEHWSMEQCSQIMRQCGILCDQAEFYACMNMLWSDFCEVIQEIGQDHGEFWAKLAKAFLDDPDAQGNKLTLYYQNVVK